MARVAGRVDVPALNVTSLGHWNVRNETRERRGEALAVCRRYERVPGALEQQDRYVEPVRLTDLVQRVPVNPGPQRDGRPHRNGQERAGETGEHVVDDRPPVE